MKEIHGRQMVTSAMEKEKARQEIQGVWGGSCCHEGGQGRSAEVVLE